MANPAIGAGNTTVTYNSSDITQYCNQADINMTLTQIDVTNLASTGAESLVGFPEHRIRLQGFWDAAIDAILGPDAVTPTKRDAAIEYADATGASVEYAWTANALILGYNPTTSPKDAAKFTCELVLSGAPERTATPA